MESKEYSDKLLSGQLDVDITLEMINVNDYKLLNHCPYCGGELKEVKVKSRPYRRTRHKLQCEYCEYYEIKEPNIERNKRIKETKVYVNS